MPIGIETGSSGYRGSPRKSSIYAGCRGSSGPTTYIKVAGQWKYLYRAVDSCGDTVDFLLTARRDKAAARRFLERAIGLHDVPQRITIDKSGANTAAMKA